MIYMDDEKDFCPECGYQHKEDDDVFQAFDLQNEYKELWFCSPDCLNRWVNKKITGLATTLIIGVVAAVLSLGETPSLWFFWLLLPYMIRQTWRNWNSSGIGGFITFMVVIFGTVSIVYPVYKIIQEIRNYLAYKATYRSYCE